MNLHAKIAASSLAAISAVLRKRAAMLRGEVAAPSPDLSDNVTGGTMRMGTLERLMSAAAVEALPLEREFDHPTVVLEALVLPAASA